MPPVAESALEVKADFPIFARRFGARELIYLDSGATAQKPLPTYRLVKASDDWLFVGALTVSV